MSSLKEITAVSPASAARDCAREEMNAGEPFINCTLKAKKGLIVQNTKNNDYSGLSAEIEEGEKIIVKNE